MRTPQRQPRWQPPQNPSIKHPQETVFRLHVNVPPQTGTLGEARAMALPPSLRPKLKKNPEMGGKRQVL